MLAAQALRQLLLVRKPLLCSHWTCLCSSEDEDEEAEKAAAKRAKRVAA